MNERIRNTYSSHMEIIKRVGGDRSEQYVDVFLMLCCRIMWKYLVYGVRRGRSFPGCVRLNEKRRDLRVARIKQQQQQQPTRTTTTRVRWSAHESAVFRTGLAIASEVSPRPRDINRARHGTFALEIGDRSQSLHVPCRVAPSIRRASSRHTTPSYARRPAFKHAVRRALMTMCVISIK